MLHFSHLCIGVARLELLTAFCMPDFRREGVKSKPLTRMGVESLLGVRLRGMAKPSFGWSVNVDSVPKISTAALVLSIIYDLETGPWERLLLTGLDKPAFLFSCVL